MSRADLQLSHSTMGLLGSFWSRVVSDETKHEARALTSLASNAAGLRDLEKHARKLLSQEDAAVSNVLVPFLDGDYVHIGQEFANKWRAELGLPAGQKFVIVRRSPSSPTASTLLVSAAGRPLGEGLGGLLAARPGSSGYSGVEDIYVVPLPAGLSPVVIATKVADRYLTQGIDFEVGDGYLIMRESPGDVLPVGGFTVTIGKMKMGNPYDFTMQVDAASRGHGFVASYYRGSCSLTSFERAAAQAAGFKVLSKADKLQAAHTLSNGATRYVFSVAGVVDIAYAHKKLNVADAYPAGFIISNGFRMVGAGYPGWLSAAAAGRTICLDGVLPVQGLYLPVGLVRADYAEVGAGGKPHTRLGLAGETSDVSKLNAAQREHEVLTGVYMSDFIGLSPTVPIKMLDYHTLLENFFGNHLVLVIPSEGTLPDPFMRRLEAFVKREKPLGASVAILKDAPAAAATPSGGLLFNGPPILYNGVPILFSQAP